MKVKISGTLIFLLVLTSITFAQLEDVKGSKDHPFISRYPGSYIYHYNEKEFEEFYILLGPVRSPSDRDIQQAKREKLEGKVTKIQYQVPKNRSSLEVFKNYEEAIKGANLDILYSARGGEIAGIRKFLSPYFWNVYASRDDESKFFYLSAKNRAKDVAISVCVLPGFDGPIVLVGIVELKVMQKGLINARDIYEGINREGHVPIYGILFDFGRADIRPESKPVLDEIARFLKEYPDIKLYVVGHTDDLGSIDYNLELSKRRAASVVKELVEKHGIGRERLKPYGVGPLAPRAANDTEEGRAKNRRVELVRIRE